VTTNFMTIDFEEWFQPNGTIQRAMTVRSGRSRTDWVKGAIFAVIVALLTVCQTTLGYPGRQRALQHSLLVGIISGNLEPVFMPRQEVADYLAKHAGAGDRLRAKRSVATRSPGGRRSFSS
jgi:hypothetical protein